MVRIIGVIVLVLVIIVEGSDASIFSEIRRIMAVAPEVNRTKISPSPTPIPEMKPEKNLDVNNTSSAEKPEKLKPGKHVDLNNTSTEKPKKSPVPEKEKVPQVEKKGLNGTVPVVAKNETQLHKENQEVINEKCEPSANKCTVQEKMIACLKHSNNGSPNFIILIQNEGESILNVSVRVSASVEVSLKELHIREHQAKKINASINTRETHKIVLNSVYGDCVLYTGVPVSEGNSGNFFQRIPYANQVTPIYGAYFMFLVALIVGGTWGCCKLRKKGQRGNGGVPYQELEMALPESATAVNVDPENGWDQGWDDDWDEDRTIKSPGNHVGNLSANGLTSRSTNRDGWENDWDD